MTRNATERALHAVSSAPALQPRDPVEANARRANIDGAHRVIAELDVHGEIDSHAAMCLQLTITDVAAGTAVAIIIDLRDLIAIDEAAIAVLKRAQDVCRGRGIHLGLLIGVRGPQDTLAHALGRAGLTTQSHVDDQRPPPRPTPPRRERLRLLPASTSARGARSR